MTQKKCNACGAFLTSPPIDSDPLPEHEVGYCRFCHCLDPSFSSGCGSCPNMKICPSEISPKNKAKSSKERKEKYDRILRAKESIKAERAKKKKAKKAKPAPPTTPPDFTDDGGIMEVWP